MKLSAKALKDEPILTDRAAHYFGSAGQVFLIRAKLKANGTLTLTQESLTFAQDNAEDIVIPLHTIERMGMGRWHEGLGTFVPVLKITYQGNLIIGVQVAHPERWIEAVESLLSRQHLPALKGPERTGFSPLRHSRIVLIILLIITLVMTALPTFFSWMHRTTVQEQNPEAAQSPPSRAG